MGYIVWLLKNQKKDRDANSKGTMLLLRVQLIEYHDKYMKLEDIPSYAYQNFMEMYDTYHELGGNGMIAKMKKEIEELHLKKKGDSISLQVCRFNRSMLMETISHISEISYTKDTLQPIRRFTVLANIPTMLIFITSLSFMWFLERTSG